jgi:glc operon protein GlcG
MPPTTTKPLRLIVLVTILLVVLSILVAPTPMQAQQPPSPPVPSYGESISLEHAKAVIAAAEAEAKKNGWPVAIAIVDCAGQLVAFERMNDTQTGSIQVAIAKAETSAKFRRPSKAFEEMLEKGGANLKVLNLPGAIPIEGGVPIVHEGKIIGAVGVSGVKSNEDGMVAAAGAAVAQPK